ncbi:hypothetical protein VUR80DRAFT_5978 [Thermomyces stellatus]
MPSRSLIRWSFRSLYALCEARFCALLLYATSGYGAQTSGLTKRYWLTDSTEGGAFLYRFSRFLFGLGLWVEVDFVVDVLTSPLSSCFTVGRGEVVAGDEMGLGYIPVGRASKSETSGISNCEPHVRTAVRGDHALLMRPHTEAMMGLVASEDEVVFPCD